MSRTYLSWDVGIKNLAYCLIKQVDINSDDPNFEIKKWGIISLGEADKSCCEQIINKNKKKPNKPCNGKVKFQADNDKYYCEKHIKNIQDNKQDEILSLEGKHNLKCKYIVKDHECGKKSAKYFTDPTITYCSSHAVMMQKNTITKINKINSNKIPVQTLAINLFNALSSDPDFLLVNEVLIENQPTLKNPTMKTISMLLYSYFVMNGLSDNKKPESLIEIVKFICPSNKLKVSSDAGKKINENKDNKRKTYVMTKMLGIKFCTELIKKDAVNLALINGMKKKDDMCDAFLQGYYCIFCKKGVSKDVEEILNKLVPESNNDQDKNNAIDLLDVE